MRKNKNEDKKIPEAEIETMLKYIISNYDFKNEFLSKLNGKKNELEDIFKNVLGGKMTEYNDSYLKWLIYRKCEETLKIDCDSCPLATTIYKKLWVGKDSEDKGKKLCQFNIKTVNGSITLSGDTMTSAHITFKEYLRAFHAGDEVSYAKVKEFFQIFGYNKDSATAESRESLNKKEGMLLKNGNVPSNLRKGKDNTMMWTNYLLALYATGHIIEINDEMLKFLTLYHSIGNFLPVPLGFNHNRSNFGEHDYVDLMLLAIYKWYCKNSNTETKTGTKTYKIDSPDDDLINLLAPKEVKPIENAKLWLMHYKTWDNFIEKNYLQDFLKDLVEEDKIDQTSKYGKPKMLWTDHSFEKPKVAGLTNVKEFLENVNKPIIARGKRIIRELDKKMGNQI